MLKNYEQDVSVHIDRLDRLLVLSSAGNVTAAVVGDVTEVNLRVLDQRVRLAWERDFTQLPAIEQGCAVMPAPNDPSACEVRMLGGEFCGNAVGAVASLLAQEKATGSIYVAGAGALPFERRPGGAWVSMPVNQMHVRPLDAGRTLVMLPLTWQLVAMANHSDLIALRVLQEFRKQQPHLFSAPAAFGVSIYEKKSSRAEFAIWVDSLNDYYRDSACGTGTTAIAVALALQQRADVSLRVLQPSGTAVDVAARFDPRRERISEVRMGGSAEILYDGPLDLTGTSVL